MIQAMCLRPEILRGFAGFGDCVYPGGLLERRVKELVIITSSKTNDCQFCTNSHCDLVDIADIVADPLVAIERTESLVPPERIAIAYTRAVMTDEPHPRAAGAGAARALHRPELVELTFLIGYINMLNLFNNALGVRYNGEYSLLRSVAG
jgi:alkylhydroperoxidase family enzyme